MRPIVLSSLLPLFVSALFFQDSEKESLAVDLSKLPEASEEQKLALETLNGFRLLHGLEPVKMDRRLIASAAFHASTMAKSKNLTHKDDKAETSDAMKRAKSFGYSQGVAELVAMGMPDSPFAVVTFIDAPYHRRLLLKPGQFDFGCATESGFSCFVLGGQAAERIVFSPPHQSEGVPTTWDGKEQPDPMRGTGLKAPYGYPILIAAYGANGGLVLETVSLIDSTGKKVDCVVREPKNDAEARDCVIVVPKKPLSTRTAYTVNAKFNCQSGEKSETWTFRTGSV